MAISEADKESAKLTATYVNGFAIAVAAIGGLAPIINAVYATEPMLLEPWQIAGVSIGCFVASAVLHIAAKCYLKRELSR